MHRIIKKNPVTICIRNTYEKNEISKAELLQLNRTQFSSLGIFVSKKVGNQKN